MPPSAGWLAGFLSAHEALTRLEPPAGFDLAVRSVCAAVGGTDQARYGMHLLGLHFSRTVAWEEPERARRALVRWRRFADAHPELECCASRLRLSAASLEVIRLHGSCKEASATAWSVEHLVRGLCGTGEFAPDRRGELLVSVAHVLLDTPDQCPVKTYNLCADASARMGVGVRDAAVVARSHALHAHAAARLGLDVEARRQAARALAGWPPQLRHTRLYEELLRLGVALGSPCPLLVARVHLDLVVSEIADADPGQGMATSAVLALVALADACAASMCATEATKLLRPTLGLCSSPALRALVCRRLVSLMARNG